MNTVVVIDAGGRGAALVHAYSKSPHVEKIIAIPGNDLMAINSSKPVVTYQNLKTTSVSEIIEICKKEKPIFIDVAQDNAVAVGLTDALQNEGFTVFGPTKKAGQVEWDKAWAREFMKRHSIAQPDFYVFHSVAEGKKFLETQPDQQWFVKASGLAEGKGALPAKSNKEAEEKIDELQKFGESGKTYLLENWLQSENSLAEEFSTFVISDGKHYQIIGSAQDHKRALDGDKGENTGGMGVSTPPLVLSADIMKQVEDITKKTVEGLAKEGRPYKGILYIGGIIVKEKISNIKYPISNIQYSSSEHSESRSFNDNSSHRPEANRLLDEARIISKVYMIEYNARWGDPEAEVIIPSIQNDLYELAMAVITGNLKRVKVITDNKARVAVAGVAKGYPSDYSSVKGKEIFGIDTARKMPGVLFYSAGIKVSVKGEPLTVKGKEKNLNASRLPVNAKFFANGGRLFYFVGEGKDVADARKHAYSAIEKVSIEGENLHYRHDIGWRDVLRLGTKGTKENYKKK